MKLTEQKLLLFELSSLKKKLAEGGTTIPPVTKNEPVVEPTKEEPIIEPEKEITIPEEKEETSLTLEAIKQTFESVPGYEKFVELIGQDQIKTIASESKDEEEFLVKVSTHVENIEEEKPNLQKEIAEFWKVGRENLEQFEKAVVSKINELEKAVKAEREAPPSLEATLARVRKELGKYKELKTVEKLVKKRWEELYAEFTKSERENPDSEYNKKWYTGQLKQFQFDPFIQLNGVATTEKIGWIGKTTENDVAGEVLRLSRNKLLAIKSDAEFIAALSVMKDAPDLGYGNDFINRARYSNDVLGALQLNSMRTESSEMDDRLEEIDRPLNPIRTKILEKYSEKATEIISPKYSRNVLNLLSMSVYDLDSVRERATNDSYESPRERNQYTAWSNPCGFRLAVINPTEVLDEHGDVDKKNEKALFQLVGPDDTIIETGLAKDTALELMKQKSLTYFDSVMEELVTEEENEETEE
jgi:hypothetical protein